MSNTAPTFNIGDGAVNTDLGSTIRRDYPDTLLVQPDGKLVVVGSAGWQFIVDDNDIAVVRYNADGSLDTGFGTGGKVLWDARGIGWMENVTDAKLLPDGKILMVCSGDGSNTLLARLNANGSPDTSFGTDGVLVVNTVIPDGPSGITVLTDGSMLISGNATENWPDNNSVYLMKVLANGSLDSSFGSNGEVQINLTAVLGLDWGSSEDWFNDLTVQSDGKIVAVGRAGGGYTFQNSVGVAMRFNSDGSLDTGFGGGDGIATVPLDGAINPAQVVVLADGKILQGLPT